MVYSGEGSATGEVVFRVLNGLTGPITLRLGFPSNWSNYDFAIGPPFPTVDASVCWANGGECRIPFSVTVDPARWPRDCYDQTFVDFTATAGTIERYDSIDVHVNEDMDYC